MLKALKTTYICKDPHSEAFQLTFIQTFRKYLGAFDKVKSIPPTTKPYTRTKMWSAKIISNFNFSVKISICTQQCHILYSMSRAQIKWYNSTKEIKRVVLDSVHSALPHYLNLRVIKLITEVSLVLDSAYISEESTL